MSVQMKVLVKYVKFLAVLTLLFTAFINQGIFLNLNFPGYLQREVINNYLL